MTTDASGRSNESVDVPSGAELLVDPLVAGFTEGDPETVRSTGHAIACLVDTSPDTARSLADALIERLDRAKPEPFVRALATLTIDHDDVVREALLAATDRREAGRCYHAIEEAEPWPVPDRRPDGGGGAVAEDETLTAVRRVIETAGTQMEGDVSGTPDPIERDSEATEGGDDPDGASTAADRAPGRPTSVRTRAEADGEEYGVGVRLFDLSGDESFAESLCGRLDGWRHLSRADGVITVVDHGASPRPWAITEYVEQTLAGRGRIDAAEVLTHARALTGALVTVHQRGLVHGGIDPRDVVYPADTLGGARPMLDNVGLMAAYRTAANPAEFLDPRYAAPEYFESCYGCLDHATDIYGLGVVLYRIATGYPPFEGSHDDIRRQVIEDRPPAPSAVNTDLPGTIDDVIAKATAKNKLTRYETAQRFHREVCRICEAVG